MGVKKAITVRKNVILWACEQHLTVLEFIFRGDALLVVTESALASCSCSSAPSFLATNVLHLSLPIPFPTAIHAESEVHPVI